MPKRDADTPAKPAAPAEELVGHLIEDLSLAFDLATPLGDRTLGAAVAQRIRALRLAASPEWGGEGSMTQVARLETGPLDFYYRPHLFADMDPALRLGHQLQFDLLPRRLPAHSPLRIAAVLESYCHLSGDLLGWRLEQDELFLWIADVSGHGVRAGLAAAVLYLLVDAVSRGQEPAEFARQMNDSMLQARSPSDHRTLFATAFWLRIGANGRGVYASCGHPPMLLRRAAGGVEPLAATGRPLGLLPRQSFEQVEIRLDPGDRLCLFTDGLIETRDPGGDEFDQPRLEQLLRRPAATPLDLSRAIYRAIRKYRESNLLDDDLTFLVVEPA